VNIDRQCWSSVRNAAAAVTGTIVDVVPRGQIGWIDIPTDWPSYVQSWSKNHRSKMQRSLRRLLTLGEVRFHVASQLHPSEVIGLLEDCFAVEDMGWKGTEGTSVLRSPGKREFYLCQAEQLAALGQFLIAHVTLNGRMIAFDFGGLANGVYHSRKVGYDPQYAACSPGQLLQQHLLECLTAAGEVRSIDCMGPISDAVRCWRPRTYQMGRVVIAARGPLWNLAYRSYSQFWQSRRNRKTAARRTPSPVAEEAGEYPLTPLSIE